MMVLAVEAHRLGVLLIEYAVECVCPVQLYALPRYTVEMLDFSKKIQFHFQHVAL